MKEENEQIKSKHIDLESKLAAISNYVSSELATYLVGNGYETAWFTKKHIEKI